MLIGCGRGCKIVMNVLKGCEERYEEGVLIGCEEKRCVIEYVTECAKRVR